jgi:isochorismate synthase
MIFLQTSAPAERRQQILDEAAAVAERSGHAVLACVSQPALQLDAIALFRRASAVDGNVWYWEQPTQAVAMTGAGIAWSLHASGDDRFGDAGRAWKSMTDHAVGDVGDLICFGGFAFDGARARDEHWRAFGDGEIAVPEFLYLRKGGRARITRCTLVGPDGTISTPDSRLDAIPEGNAGQGEHSVPGELALRRDAPDADTWQRAVDALTAAIRDGRIDKVVLAREVVLTARTAIDAPSVLAALREAYPACTTFAARRGGACFLGATPERLVRIDRGRVSVACLAGSSRRGATSDDDAAAGAALVSDPKERSEHDLVLRMILAALAPVCEEIQAPPEPTLMRMQNVQHLHTPIEAALRGDAGVLDLVARLHPTPAVGGVPSDRALDLIGQHEPFDRGWYAGPIGWMDARGNGEFAVAIRSGLVGGEEARLYAGCGIVRDSEPEREFEESLLKLRPMLCALNLH